MKFSLVTLLYFSFTVLSSHAQEVIVTPTPMIYKGTCGQIGIGDVGLNNSSNFIESLQYFCLYDIQHDVIISTITYITSGANKNPCGPLNIGFYNVDGTLLESVYCNVQDFEQRKDLPYSFVIHLKKKINLTAGFYYLGFNGVSEVGISTDGPCKGRKNAPTVDCYGSYNCLFNSLNTHRKNFYVYKTEIESEFPSSIPVADTEIDCVIPVYNLTVGKWYTSHHVFMPVIRFN